MTNPNAQPVKLLVVDDVAENRAIISRYFGQRGFEITEAENGAAALERIAEHQFDAVLLDVLMPEMDGLEALRRIRADHSPSSLPVIMVTAKVESKDVVQALELGANDYITKPIDFAIVSARLQSQLARLHAERQLEHYIEQLEKTNSRLEHEIAERKQSEARVRYMAQHDSLTGLDNRVHFRDLLVRALAHIDDDGGNLALLFMDLDQFKLINDSLGHRIGDLLLAGIGERLKGTLRPDDVVARLGGDEFAIVHVAKEPTEAAALAQRIMKAIALPYEIEGHQLVVGCSIGIAWAPDDGNDPDILLANADLALYRAKADGRSRCCFFEAGMNARAQARRVLEGELRRAVQCAEFELYYQPLFNLSAGRVSGFEALLRWNHPERGMIPPCEFIPLAEDTGLIIPLSKWVLREACRQANTWPADIKLAVNLSPIQFRGESLVPDVINALSASGLAPDRLELEITETVLLDDNKGTLQALNRFHDMGVRISMDDFGIGYSSFRYLRMFPFDKIKIDQSFVRDLPAQYDSTAIVRAIIGLAGSLGMVTTAEGVETSAQLSYLQTQGCTEVQGYLISRPVPAAAIGALFARTARAEHRRQVA